MPTNKPLQSIVITNNTTTSVVFAGIDQTYTDLRLVSSIQTVGNATPTIQYNGNASNIYSQTIMYGSGATTTVASRSGYSQIDLTSWAQFVPTSGSFNLSVMHICNYSNSTTFKTALIRSAQSNDARIASSVWRSTDPIVSLTISTGSPFQPGTTFDLYGIGPDSRKANGGDIIRTDGTYWYHAFINSGLFVPAVSSLTADVLVVAGGGGGGSGDNANQGAGGGGAGGVVYQTGRTITSAVALTIGAGGGGAGWGSGNGSNGTKGVDSTFSGLTATGGGYGATVPEAGGPGGSGGGAGAGLNALGGTASAGSGGGTGYAFAGGAINPAFNGSGGGGGGAGAAGGNATSNSSPGNGGAGNSTWSSWLSVVGLGVSGFIAGGGGGGSYNSVSSTGGSGGGGAGNASNVSGVNGTTNTGSGGGGSSGTSWRKGGNGGSGLVIVRYAV
jgi:hypothetical protein